MESVLRSFPTSLGAYATHIATMRRDGSDVRKLLADDKGFRWDLDVSPHGHKLAFIERLYFGAPRVLRIMDLRSGRTTTIPASETGPIDAFAWSPGATRIVYFDVSFAPGSGGRFCSSTTCSSSVYSIRPDGTDRKLLFTQPYNERSGSWDDSLSWQPPR
jgi:Tol biopolymer transport system component